MNQIKTKVNALSLLLPVLLLLAGCSKTEVSLLDSVPQGATVVATANIDRLLKDAGCQVASGNYRLTPDVERLLHKFHADGLSTWIKGAAPAIDLSRVVIFSPGGSDAILTFSLSDEGKIADAATRLGYKPGRGVDGYDLYDGPDGRVMLVKDGQGWISTDASAVTRAVKAAGNKPLAKGVSDFLLADNPVNVALNTPFGHCHWACGAMTLSESSMAMTVVMMDDDGNTADMGKDLGLIDTSFLKYTPGETQLAVAAAVNPGLPWKDVLSTAQMIPGLDFGTRMMVESVLSQLQLAEGTVSLAAAPAAGAPALATFSFATWDVIAMARFPEAVTGETVDRITGMARMAGLAVSLDQGIYTADLSAVDRRLGSLYYGALDGNLALSTRPFDSMTDNQLASVFEGKSAAAVLDIPYRSETMKALELPYGINVTAQIDGGRLQIRARFNGSNSSFMSTLAKML